MDPLAPVEDLLLGLYIEAREEADRAIEALDLRPEDRDTIENYHHKAGRESGLREAAEIAYEALGEDFNVERLVRLWRLRYEPRRRAL